MIFLVVIYLAKKYLRARFAFLAVIYFAKRVLTRAKSRE